MMLPVWPVWCNTPDDSLVGGPRVCVSGVYQCVPGAMTCAAVCEVTTHLYEKSIGPALHPALPCAACPRSVQYMQQPERVFAEIYRVLKPGGVVIMSFSNRMFYTKAIQAWRDATDYGRIGLVKQYFMCVQVGCRAGGLGDVAVCNALNAVRWLSPAMMMTGHGAVADWHGLRSAICWLWHRRTPV